MLVREGRLPGTGIWGVLGFAFALALSLVLLNPQGAGAATSYSYVGAFGAPGSGDLQFNSTQMAQRAAVHHASGKLFIADPGNDRVQVFSPTASGVAYAFTIATDDPLGLAVDPSNADLYVSSLIGIKRFKAVNPSPRPANPLAGT